MRYNRTQAPFQTVCLSLPRKMRSIEEYFIKFPDRVFTLLMLLAIPAFFINLGMLPLFGDEPTRANVALEMILSKNYAVPTVGGEYYYNKPPLYNWILAFCYLCTQSYSELITRLPALIPLFLYCISIYLSVNYFLKDKWVALISAMFLLLNGRMLVYDSMLGHIDIFYSWLTYLSFICIFYFYQKQQWFWLFFSSYCITAITFLCKGMPSVVFQGFTLIAWLSYTRNFKKLFSWQHIVSGLFCVGIIALYFYNYSRYNPNLEYYFSTIWDQSSQRTASRAGIGKTISHLVQFPFEHLGHLFPASLLVLFCFKRNFFQQLKQQPFLLFISLVFISNIWVYWLSPETRPRYLLMLYPLLIIVFSDHYIKNRIELPLLNKVFEGFILTIGLVLSLAAPLAWVFQKLPEVPYLELKVGVLTCLLALLSWAIFCFKNLKIVPFLGILILARLGFSWFVIPHRAQVLEESYFKQAAIEMGAESKNEPFYFYQYHPDVLTIPFHDRLIFYIERTKMAKVKFTEADLLPGYYLTFDRDLQNPQAVLLKTYNNNLKLFKVK